MLRGSWKQVPWLLLASSFQFCGCNYFDLIPVIGLDNDNRPAQVFVPTKEYISKIAAASSTVHESALPVLNNRPNGKAWSIRTFVVGIGLNTQIGIGPFQIGAFPSCRLIFENTANPTNVP